MSTPTKPRPQSRKSAPGAKGEAAATVKAARPSAPVPLELDPITGAAALAEHHAALVPYASRHFFPNIDADTRDELEGAGYVALLNAARRFDPSTGKQFSTYAVNCIRGAMLKAWNIERGGVFCSPSLGNGKARLEDLPGVVSLDAPQSAQRAAESDARTLAESLPDAPETEPEAILLEREESAEFWQRFGRAGLTEREVEVIACCYGFDEEDEARNAGSTYTPPPVVCPPGCFLIYPHIPERKPKPRTGLAVGFNDAAAHLKVSREAVRQIHNRAIGQLQRAMLPA